MQTYICRYVWLKGKKDHFWKFRLPTSFYIQLRLNTGCFYKTGDLCYLWKLSPCWWHSLLFIVSILRESWLWCNQWATPHPSWARGWSNSKVTLEHRVLSTSSDKSRGKPLRSPTKCMFTYRQALYAATPLYSWHVCLSCVFELMFFTNRVACWRIGCQNTAFLIPLLSLQTEWGLTENRRWTCWHLKQIARWWIELLHEALIVLGTRAIGGLSLQHVCVLVSSAVEPIAQRSYIVLYIYLNHNLQ